MLTPGYLLLAELQKDCNLGEEAKELLTWSMEDLEDLFERDWDPEGELEQKWAALVKHVMPTVSVFDGRKDDLQEAVTVATEAHVYWYMIYAMEDKCFSVNPSAKKKKGKPTGKNSAQVHGDKFIKIVTMVTAMRKGKDGGGQAMYKYRAAWEEGVRELLNVEEDEPISRSGAKKRKRSDDEPAQEKVLWSGYVDHLRDNGWLESV